MRTLEVHLMAVSYTHLDVYKRQVLIKGVIIIDRVVVKFITPVSYTHLDVYKRQTLYCP